MKLFKNISILSDGSLYFCYKTEASSNNILTVVYKQDEINFNLNQKKKVDYVKSKYSSHYKKRYLK